MVQYRLYILDANSIVAWCHYSAMSGAGNEDYSTRLSRWWKSFSLSMNPRNVIACFDCSRASNWRKKLFVEYKSGRDSKPADIAFAKAAASAPVFFDSLGIAKIHAEGFEADDLVATISNIWDGEVIVVSTDKDLRQLVDERVTVYDPMPNKAGVCVLYNEDEVLAKHHVHPGRLREALAIMGDSSDSIPGVPGLGKVAAVTMIKQTRSKMEMIRLARESKLKDISVKKQELFISHLKDFDLSYELVGLRFDAWIPDGLDMSYSLKTEEAE